MATPQGNDTVYVAGLPDTVSERDIAAHFGSIGQLKQDKKRRCEKIWLYRDRDTGLPKGDATVSYMDPHAAEAAVNWFNSTQFMGRTLSVSLAERKGGGESLNLPASHFADPLGRNANADNAANDAAHPDPTSAPNDDDDAHARGNPARAPGAPKERRDGDWPCPNASCGNVNFAYRGQCNRCGAARPASAGGGGVGKNDKPNGIFGPDDWTCSNCFNVNWARRKKCNECGAPKEGKAKEPEAPEEEPAEAAKPDAEAKKEAEGASAGGGAAEGGTRSEDFDSNDANSWRI